VLAAARRAASLAMAALLEGRRARTLGARAAGIRVVDAGHRRAHRPGPGHRALVRPHHLLAAVRRRLLWMLVDANRQTWHDKLTTSVVGRVGPA
jgi:uncharacterized RDD family membrane protein YckC